MNNILYYLKKSQEFLEKKGIPNARLDAEVLLADVLNMERIRLYSKFDMPLSAAEENTYRSKIMERGKFRPVAYITGKKSFYHDDFLVNESVLIPRPETEELVEWVLQENPDDNYNVLDMCTGSGCIGITLKKERPAWNVSGSDISPQALEIAKKNATAIIPEIPIEFVVSDLLESIPRSGFQIIVTNPPYIPLEEKKHIMPDVLFEPETALFLENQGDFFQRLFSSSLDHLVEGGKMYMEIHENFAALMEDTAREAGFSEIVTKRDLAGKNRMMKFSVSHQ